MEKLFTEELFATYGGVSVRPGLIASWRHPGAAFLSLINIAKNSKIIPLLSTGGKGFYFCDLEFVVLGIFLLANLRLNKPHTATFCYREPLSLRDTLLLIERRYGLSTIKLPVPWQLVYPALLVKEAIFGKSKVRADSILDFAYPPKSPSGRAFYAYVIAVIRHHDPTAALAHLRADTFWFLEGPEYQETSRSFALLSRRPQPGLHPRHSKPIGRCVTRLPSSEVFGCGPK